MTKGHSKYAIPRYMGTYTAWWLSGCTRLWSCGSWGYIGSRYSVYVILRYILKHFLNDFCHYLIVRFRGGKKCIFQYMQEVNDAKQDKEQFNKVLRKRTMAQG